MIKIFKKFLSLLDVKDNDFIGKNGFIPKVNESLNKLELLPENVSSSTKYTTTFGDGIAIVYIITHNLGSQYVNAQVFSATTPWEQIECVVELATINTLTLKFNNAPTLEQYRVIIIG